MDYEWFKKEILKLTTIDLEMYKERQMKRRIDSLIAKKKIADYGEYVKAIKEDKELYNEFVGYITINVSEFYRNPEQWRILEKEVIPRLLEKNGTLKMWSAACSSGDEPYTLVMVLRKFLEFKDIKIVATDIDKEIIKKAKEGKYQEKSLVGLPDEFKKKYFEEKDKMFHIKKEVKDCVEFKYLNLLKDDYPKGFDLIVCRNVLIYFTEEAKSGIYTNFNRSLKDNSILFIGSTEQILSSVNYGFKAIRTFFYNKEKTV